MRSFVRELIVAVVLVVAFSLVFSQTTLRHSLDGLLDHRRGDLYSALLSLEITLLGFVVAILAIVLGYAQAPRFEIIRRTRQWPKLFGSYTRTMRWAACATLGTLIALLGDRDNAPQLVLTILCLVPVLFSALFTIRMLWVTEKVVQVVVQTKARVPGE